MGAPPEISGFVLAGGRSSRLGCDKALLPWPPNAFAEGNTQTFLGHTIARLQCVCSTVSICANRDDLPFPGAIIPDSSSGSGPLGGIVAALEHSSTDWNLMLAVDLPFLPVEVLQALAARASLVKNVGAASNPLSPPTVACILPMWDGQPQPLCGLYHCALAPALRVALEAGKLKVMGALHEACDRVAASPQIQSESPFCIEMWDPAAFAATLPSEPNPSDWFLNINSPEDWRQAQLRCFR